MNLVMRFTGFELLVWDEDESVNKVMLKDLKTVDLARQIAERFREEVDSLPPMGGDDHG